VCVKLTVVVERVVVVVVVVVVVPVIVVVLMVVVVEDVSTHASHSTGHLIRSSSPMIGFWQSTIINGWQSNGSKFPLQCGAVVVVAVVVLTVLVVVVPLVVVPVVEVVVVVVEEVENVVVMQLLHRTGQSNLNLYPKIWS
jgi:hypothetical protein